MVQVYTNTNRKVIYETHVLSSIDIFLYLECSLFICCYFLLLSGKDKLLHNGFTPVLKQNSTIVEGGSGITARKFLVPNFIFKNKLIIKLVIQNYSKSLMQPNSCQYPRLQQTKMNHHSHPRTILPCKILFSPRNYTSFYL